MRSIFIAVLAATSLLTMTVASTSGSVNERTKASIFKMNDTSVPVKERIEFGWKQIEKIDETNDELASFTIRSCLLGLLVRIENDRFDELKTEVEALLPKIKDDYALGIYHMYRGDELSLKQKQIKNAIVEFSKAISLSNRADNQRTVGSCLNRIGYCYGQLGALDSATRTYRELVEFSQQENFPDLEIGAINNLAFLLLSLRRLDEAREVYNTIELGNSPMVDMYVYAGFADIATKEKRGKEALQWIAKCFESMGDKMSPRERAVLNILKATAFQLTGEFKQAEEHCNIALKETEFGHRTEDANIILGKVYAATDRFDQGVELIKSATDSKRFASRTEALRALVEIYSDNNLFEGANKYLTQLHDLEKQQQTRESAINIEVMKSNLKNQEQLMQARLDYQTEMQKIEEQASMDRMQAENSRLIAAKATVEANWNRIARNASLVVTLVLLAGAYFYSKKVADQKKTSIELAVARKEAELQHQIEQKRRLESIGLLTGSVAHDFNNLLQVFSISIHNLQKLSPEQESDTRKAVFRSLTETVEIGSRITDQLLSFSRNQSDSKKFFSLAQLFESADILFSAAVGDELQIKVEMENPAIRVYVDRAGFYNSMLNLLLNAADASVAGDVLTIAVSECSRQTVTKMTNDPTVWSSSDSSDLDQRFTQITVVDSGHGMSKDVLEQCLHNQFSTKMDGKGNGLGLPSVVRFVESAGGFLTVSSQPKQGTQVSMFLPSVENMNIPANNEKEVTLGDIQLNKIAIVEDNELVRSSLLKTLSDLGGHCTGFENAAAAIKSFEQSFDFELVISDVRMPGGKSGYDLKDWMAKRHPNTTIILMSGNPAPSGTRQLFLKKPFISEELLEEIRKSVC